MSDAISAAALRARDAMVWRDAQAVFDRPFVVEAGAGTGKTTLLVARCLAWMLGRGWEGAEQRLSGAGADRVAAEVLSRVAALTFTEAAAAEMAKRVGDAFAELAAGRLPEWVDEAALPGSSGLRAARAAALLGALDRLLVRTIHAFCRRLLAQYALEAGLHPDFEVDADDRGCQAAAREAVEAAVAEGYGDPGDPDLIALALDGFGPPELEAALAALLASGTLPRELAADPFSPEAIRSWLEDLDARLRDFRETAGGRLEGTAKKSGRTHETLDAIAATQRVVAGGASDAASVECLSEALRKAWSDKCMARLRQWSRGDFGTSESAALGDASEGSPRSASALHRAIEHATQIRPKRLERARRVLSNLLAVGRERMRTRGEVGYMTLLRGARDLLRDHPEVRARARAELDQLLIDEFQDTDRVQCEILRWLALEGPMQQRPGLFLVGDPKQSIYGWREADLRAYEDFVSEALGPGHEPQRLAVNRRSTPAILAEVARVIEPVMHERAGVQPAFQPLVASLEREADPGSPGPARSAVEHWVSWDWDEAAGAGRRPRAAEAARIEARAVAQDLVRLRQSGEIEWRDAGVLLRARGDLETYLQALRAAGVPYAVERDRSYYRRREVIDACALVCCVLDPSDSLALLTWLRSPSVGVPDAALLPLWTRGFPARVSPLGSGDPRAVADLARLIDEASKELPNDVPGLDRISGWERGLRHAVEAVAALRASFAGDAADVFVEQLRAFTLVEVTEAARYLGAYRLANLERFFRDLRAELESEDVDLQALLRRLRSDVVTARQAEDARPPDASEDAVRVMTIHQAKGLEFRHCYLVQLHKQPGGGSTPRVFEARELGDGLEYRVCDAPTLGFTRVEAYREEVAAAEQVRTLYVAMTRARDRLVLLGNWGEQPEATAPERAVTHVELLVSRYGERPDLQEAMARARREGSDGVPAPDGVRWVFPALAAADPAADAEPALENPFPDVEALRSEAARVAADRDRAQQRMARPFRAPASGDSHSEAREEEADRRFGVSSRSRRMHPHDLEGEIGRAAGTAVHRVLEDLRLAAPPLEELARQRERLPGLIERLAPADARSAALERALVLLERLAAPPFAAKLAALRDCVIARELPVLLPAESEGAGPVGFVSGAIDLLYRDPATSELVVADYKTDRVEGEAALAERSQRYASQAAHYRRAVQEALALERAPRFELWFLDAGAVVLVG
jgi:ATP-dependent helicase/nuclease subunit A